MYHRTTILLDPESRRAAKELAAELDVSPSEVIRRALKSLRSARGSPGEARARRRKAFQQLVASFKELDVDAEIARLKREDAYF